MKRFFFLLIIALFVSTSNAQNITDALRYSTEALNGTARFNAMSGAFGALGGDASAIAINPAGSAIFLNSTGSATFSVVDKRNKASFFNTESDASYSNLEFNQVGFIFIFNIPNQESTINRVSFGFNYMATQNFDEDLFVYGNGDTSIGAFFLGQAQGIPLDLLQLQSGESISDLYSYLGETEGVSAQNAFLGYQGFIIDPLNPDDLNNTQYFSNISPGSFNQAYSFQTSGYGGKYSFNIAAQINNNISFGINLNSNYFDYKQYTYLNETNSNPGSLVNQVGFENILYAYGRGFSAQFGAIGKITDALRVGITYDTPIWYNIYEETSQYLETERIIDGTSVNTVVDPRVVNVFYKYELRTPWRIAGSAAYVFGKQGLLSFDYAYKDYAFNKFSPSNDPAFNSENNAIKNELKGVSSFRIGGEYRMNQLSLRGGYLFEESPYKNNNTVGDLNGYSFGLGYNLGSYRLDFSFSSSKQNREQQLYTVGLTDATSVRAINNNYVMTLAYEIN